MEWTCPFCKGNKKAADLEPAANQSRIRGRNFRGVTKIRHIFVVADFFRPGGHRGEHLPGLTSIRTKTSMGAICARFWVWVRLPACWTLLPAVQSMRHASVNSSIQQNRSQGNSAVRLAEAVQGRARRAHPCKLQL